MDLFLVLYTVMLFSLKQSLTSFGDKPLTNLYSSVARTCIFLWCTETELSFSKDQWKNMYCHCILYASISRVTYLSCCLMYGYETSMIMGNKKNWDLKNELISSFLFLLFRKGAILARNLIFVLALLHIWLIWFSKLNLQSISIPNILIIFTRAYQ